MRGEKQIRAALPFLGERDLWFIECDAHRAADAAAIGGATVAHWQKYVTLEEDIAEIRRIKFPGSRCPFPNQPLVNGWTDEQYAEMGRLYKRIFSNKVKRRRRNDNWL